MTLNTRIMAGRLIDGTGSPARNNVLIDIRSGRIASVLKADPDALAGHPVTDLSQSTLLPGLMDAHVHLFMSGTSNETIRKRQLEADYNETVPVMNKHLENHLASGVIAVRDGGDRLGHVLRYKNQYIHSNEPVILKAAGRAWHQKGRYGRLIARHLHEGISLAAALAEDSESDHVKIVNSGLNSLKEFGKKTAPQFSAKDLKDAVHAAHAKNRPVMVHANGEIPVQMALDAECNSIEHGFFMGRENLQKMADKQIFWTPTACTMQAYAAQLAPGGREADMARRNLDHQLEQLQQARSLGTPVVTGTDAGSLGVDHGPGLSNEISLLITAGYPVEEAIKCAAQNTAALLGLIKEYGTLEPGKNACFLVVPGLSGDLASGLADSRTRLLIP